MLERALETLAGALGRQRGWIEDRLEAWHTHDWTADPHARGAYSYVPVGGVGAAERLARPVQDTLYFAGEATELEGRNATVHGAIASGRRAAREVLRGLGRA